MHQISSVTIELNDDHTKGTARWEDGLYSALKTRGQRFPEDPNCDLFKD